MDKSKTIYWNVDTQKDFINPDGALYVEGAEEIKPVLKELTQFARENDIKIINTCDWHYDDSEELSDSPDFVNTFPPHCMANTDGASFIEETSPKNPSFIEWNVELPSVPLSITSSKELVITKDKFDVFTGNPYSNEVVETLKRCGYETVVVYGVVSEICVGFAVDGLLKRGFKVRLVKDAIKHLNIDNFSEKVSEWKKNSNFEFMISKEITQTFN